MERAKETTIKDIDKDLPCLFFYVITLILWKSNGETVVEVITISGKFNKSAIQHVKFSVKIVRPSKLLIQYRP